MLVPSAIHAKSRVRQNAESSRNPRCSRVFNAKITHSISRRPSLVIKRSIVIDGHKTSVSLEDVFWNALKDIAHERREPLFHLVTSINANRQSANLSSAIRVYVLWYYMDQSARRRAMFERRKKLPGRLNV